MPMRLAHDFYSVQGCRSKPDDLFVFGDNFQRSGRGPRAGQAIIRDCPNAVGLAIKHEPKRTPGAYFSDADGTAFAQELRRVHNIIAPHLRRGGVVWWPADGIGTGLAEMPVRAEMLYQRLCHYARGLFREKVDERYTSAIVCGGMSFTDELAGFRGLDEVLGEQARDGTRLEIIHAGAKGADEIARKWAQARGALLTPVMPDWQRHGKTAWKQANVTMAERLKARRDQAGVEDFVIAMPGGRGTAHMLEVADARDLDIKHICSPARTPDAQTSLDL